MSELLDISRNYPTSTCEYLVVEFPDETTEDKSIPMALISSTWVFEKNKNTFCYWPNYLKSTVKREKAIKNHEELDVEKSQICAVNIKYSTAKYDNALLKLKIFEEEQDSQIESEIESFKARRVSKASNRKSEYEYSGSSEDDLFLPKIPQPEKFIPVSSSAGVQKKKNCSANEKEELTLSNLPASKRGVQAFESMKSQLEGKKDTHKYLKQPVEGQLISSKEIDNFSFASSSSVASNCHSCKSNEALLKGLIKSVEKLSQDLKYLIQINHKENENTIDVDDIKCANTFDDLREINRLLENDEEFKSLCLKLSLLGGKDVPTCTRRILSRLISHQLTLNLNWTGRNEKSGLKELGNVVKVIAASVRRNPNARNGTADEIEQVIKSWLRNSGDRDGGRMRRSKKMDS